MGETKRVKQQLVEDFHRFLQTWSLIRKVSGLEPEKTAGNRRKSQEAVLTPFSHLVSPMKRCPIFCDTPLLGLSLDCDRPSLRKEVGV